MKTINQHTLEVMRRFEGITEFAGASDCPIIVMAHKLCRIEDKDHIDEIPHCSSDMNLCMVLANIERNPHAAFTRLREKGFSTEFIDSLFGLVNHSIKALYPTEFPWVEPTWSAAAKSWKNVGVEIKLEDAQEGDFVVFVRDGGHHIAHFIKFNGMLYVEVFGGNQNNKFCLSDKYLKSRIVAVRRMV